MISEVLLVGFLLLMKCKKRRHGAFHNYELRVALLESCVAHDQIKVVVFTFGRNYLLRFHRRPRMSLLTRYDAALLTGADVRVQRR